MRVRVSCAVHRTRSQVNKKKTVDSRQWVTGNSNRVHVAVAAAAAEVCAVRLL